MKYSIQSSIAWQIWAAEPRVAKNVQQFVQGIRGAVRPLLKLRVTNSSLGSRPSFGLTPRLLLMRENLSRVVHMWGPHVSADLGNFGVGSYRGVVLSKGMGQSALRICLCDRLTSAVCFVYTLIIVLLCQECGCEQVISRSRSSYCIKLSLDSIILCWFLHYFVLHSMYRNVSLLIFIYFVYCSYEVFTNFNRTFFPLFNTIIK